MGKVFFVLVSKWMVVNQYIKGSLLLWNKVPERNVMTCLQEVHSQRLLYLS